MNAKVCRPWVLAMLLAGLAGCSGGGGGVDPNKPADVSLTAKQYAEEYKQNKDAAGQKYKGKVIELTGVVKSFGKSLGGDDVFVTLGGVEGDLFGDVQCMTADKQPWKKATPGQTVKVKGKWPEFSVTAALIEAVITDASGAGAPTLTAEQLAKEHAADPEGTNKKYDKKYLILTGEVEKVEFNDVKAAKVFLKAGVAQPKVFCSFTAFDENVTKNLKTGQQVKMMGEYALNFGKEEVGLITCILLE